jgi:hypothetical protein
MLLLLDLMLFSTIEQSKRRKDRIVIARQRLGYGLNDRRFYSTGAGKGIFLFFHRVQTGSAAHPASYPMDTGESFPGNKTAGA